MKVGGAVGAALSLGGAAVAGFVSGRSKDTYTGWGPAPYGEDQFFNRKPFYVDKPTYEVVGKPERIRYLDNIFKRNGELYRLMYAKDGEPKWDLSKGAEDLPEPLKTYYLNNSERLAEFKRAYYKADEQHKNWPKYQDQFFIADAWSTAHSTSFRGRGSFPLEPKGPPEESDFNGVTMKPYPLKSPKHGSELIKKISHTFGATLVGVTELKEEWVYQGYLRGVGKTEFKKPEHWKNVIVIAVPHEWDALYVNPTYGTSYDAYSKLNFVAGKIEIFLRKMGYSARIHVPPVDYDIIVPPIAIDAGLGEFGRNGIVITPELGANTRLAAVTTDMPLEPDKPIDIGIKKFCEKCKICAEECPSGSISMDDAPTKNIRGFKRWDIDQDKCFTVWNSVATSHSRGCRICLAVCPYSRKNNWIHRLAKEVDPYDPSGAFASAMLAMQKNFFEYPGANEYLPPPDGSNKTYGEPPEWLDSSKWFDI